MWSPNHLYGLHFTHGVLVRRRLPNHGSGLPGSTGPMKHFTVFAPSLWHTRACRFPSTSACFFRSPDTSFRHGTGYPSAGSSPGLPASVSPDLSPFPMTALLPSRTAHALKTQPSDYAGNARLKSNTSPQDSSRHTPSASLRAAATITAFFFLRLHC